MAKLHTSGKDTTPKVPYQKPVGGANILPRPESKAAKFAERYIREHPLTFKKLSDS